MQKIMRSNDERGFAFKVISTDAGVRRVAQFACVECGDCLDITNNSGRSAEWFVIRARREGWAADARNRNKCYCPRCIDDQMKTKYLAPSQAALPLGPVPVEARVPDAVFEALKRELKHTREAKEGKQPMTAYNAPREPTIEERIKIRNLLDQHFDDSAGYYLDDMSDQKIGAEVNVPWAIVARMREAAYGPIRTDPERGQAAAVSRQGPRRG